MNVLCLAALYREISGVVRTCAAGRRSRHPFRSFHASYLSHRITIAETGVGTNAAAANAAAAIDAAKPDLVISCGYAGGLTPELGVGDILLASAVHFVNANETDAIALSDPHGLRQAMAASSGAHDGTLVTMGAWAQKSEVRRLAPGIRPPAACDMETHAVARCCDEKNVPFLSVRAISDGPDDEVAFDPSCLCDASGRYSTLHSVAFFLAHPRLLPALPLLCRGSGRAGRNLTAALDRLLHLL